MTTKPLLDCVRIVLVEPSHPGNIGAVARSMRTMGLHDLCLVNPKKYPHYEASKRAAGGEIVLDGARVVDSVDAAIEDCTLVFGTSVRDREVSWPTVNPRQAASKIADHLQQFNGSEGHIAVLFGRESSGLTNAELELCQQQIRIDANPEYSSLNLASAVQIIAYDLRMQSLASDLVDSKQTPQPLSASERRQLPADKKMQDGHLQHLQTVLEALDFIKSDSPTVLYRKLRRLYSKAELTVEEVQILRGMLTAVQQRTQEN